MKKLLALVTSIFMICSLAACGGGQTAATPTPASSAPPSAAPAGQALPRVAFICKSYADTFCLAVMEEFEKAAADYSDQFTVEYFDAELDATKQNNLIETCTASGFDAIVFQQVDAEAPVSVVKAALDAGVYVVVTTGHIEDEGASWYVDADPYQQGQVLVDYAIAEGFCDDAQVAILRGVGGNFHAESRYSAFTDAIAKREDITIAAAEIANWSKNEAMTITQNWLVVYPELDVILASCDDMALGAYEAVQMAGMTDQVKIFSIDGTDAGMQAVKDGKLVANVQQDAVAYAVEALNITAKLLKGEEAQSLNIDSTLITPENVDSFLN